METPIQDTIEREITVKATKERVYAAITDPEQIVTWFPDSLEGKLEVGEEPTFNFGKDGKVQIHVTAADPYTYFAYRWIPGKMDYPQGSSGTILNQPNTLVEFHIEEMAQGTRITVKESGFASLPAETIAKTFADNTDGWEYMINRLEKLLAQV